MANEHLSVKAGFVPQLHGVELVPPGKPEKPEPGMYGENGVLIKSWAKMVEDGDVIISNGTLSTPSDKSTRFANTKVISMPDNDNITTFDYNTFSLCTDIEEVYLPNTLTKMKNQTFYDCTSLKHVVIPDSVSEMWRENFIGCSSLESIVLPASLEVIGALLLCQCTNLKSVVIPPSVEAIYQSAFAECDSLTKITIPSSVTSIDDTAFNMCYNLTTIYYSGTATGAPWGAENATVVAA